MAQVQLSERILQRLTSRAQAENKNIEELIETMLDQYPADIPLSDEGATVNRETKNLFLLLAQAAKEHGYSSQGSNVSERSREILNTEFAEYLLRRMRDQD